MYESGECGICCIAIKRHSSQAIISTRSCSLRVSSATSEAICRSASMILHSRRSTKLPITSCGLKWPKSLLISLTSRILTLFRRDIWGNGGMADRSVDNTLKSHLPNDLAYGSTYDHKIKQPLERLIHSVE